MLSIMHRRLRGARLAVRAATVAAIIVLDQLAATSSLRVQVRLMVGCGQTLGLRRPALLELRKTLLHERANTHVVLFFWRGLMRAIHGFLDGMASVCAG
jgi:hypothetical protein